MKDMIAGRVYPTKDPDVYHIKKYEFNAVTYYDDRLYSPSSEPDHRGIIRLKINKDVAYEHYRIAHSENNMLWGVRKSLESEVQSLKDLVKEQEKEIYLMRQKINYLFDGGDKQNDKS